MTTGPVATIGVSGDSSYAPPNFSPIERGLSGLGSGIAQWRTRQWEQDQLEQQRKQELEQQQAFARDWKSALWGMGQAGSAAEAAQLLTPTIMQHAGDDALDLLKILFANTGGGGLNQKNIWNPTTGDWTVFDANKELPPGYVFGNPPAQQGAGQLKPVRLSIWNDKYGEAESRMFIPNSPEYWQAIADGMVTGNVIPTNQSEDRRRSQHIARLERADEQEGLSQDDYKLLARLKSHQSRGGPRTEAQINRIVASQSVNRSIHRLLKALRKFGQETQQQDQGTWSTFVGSLESGYRAQLARDFANIKLQLATIEGRGAALSESEQEMLERRAGGDPVNFLTTLWTGTEPMIAGLHLLNREVRQTIENHEALARGEDPKWQKLEELEWYLSGSVRGVGETALPAAQKAGNVIEETVAPTPEPAGEEDAKTLQNLRMLMKQPNGLVDTGRRWDELTAEKQLRLLDLMSDDEENFVVEALKAIKNQKASKTGDVPVRQPVSDEREVLREIVRGAWNNTLGRVFPKYE